MNTKKKTINDTRGQISFACKVSAILSTLLYVGRRHQRLMINHYYEMNQLASTTISCTRSYDITAAIEEANLLAKLVFPTHLINIFHSLIDNFLEVTITV